MKIAVLFVLASVCAFGQAPKTTTTLTGTSTPGLATTIPVRPPAKPCDAKYEYSAVSADSKGYLEVCVPIMHEVTEKEWQALMERLKKLEDPPCPSMFDHNTQKSCPL